MQNIDTLFKVQLGSYFHVSSVVLFVYDYLLTFDHETAYVWNKRVGIPSILFSLNRYLPFIDLSLSFYNGVSHNDQCKTINTVIGWMFLFGIFLSETIMLLRVWVFWGRTKKITIFLCVLGATEFTSAIASYILSHFNFLSLDSLPTDVLGCHSISANALAFVDYILLMSLDTAILVLTIIRCLRNSDLRILILKHPSSLITVFIREGVISFLFLFTSTFINLILILTVPEIRSSMYSFQRCLHSIFVGRVFLHLRHSSHTTLELSEPTHVLAFAHTGRSSGREDGARSTVVS